MPQKPRHLKTATQTWVMDNRKRLGETSADLARLTGVTTDTARGWESRGAPSEDAIQILERHFGVARPMAEPGDALNATPGLAALIAAQTSALERQTAAFLTLAASIDRAADRVTGRVEDFGGVMAELLQAVRTLPTTGTNGAPDGTAHDPSAGRGR